MGCKLCGGDDSQYCESCRPERDKGMKEIHKKNYDDEKVLTFPGLKGSIADIIAEEVAKAKEESFVKVFDLHIRALSCHCECLGMNAENCIAASTGEGKIPFNEGEYRGVMQKWNLIDKEGKPII